MPDIPPKANRKWKNCFSPFRYRNRDVIERKFCRLKDFRRVATCYDRSAVAKAQEAPAPVPQAQPFSRALSTSRAPQAMEVTPLRSYSVARQAMSSQMALIMAASGKVP